MQLAHLTANYHFAIYTVTISTIVSKFLELDRPQDIVVEPQTADC